MKNYTGNKGIQGYMHKIINNIPKHTDYFELYFGRGAVFNELIYNGYQRAYYYHLNDLNKECTDNINDSGAACISCTNFPAVDFLKYLNPKDNTDSFVFLDPPYLHETRPNGIDLYGDFEMSDNDHVELLNTVKNHKHRIMITHPKCELYDTVLKDWGKVDVYVRYNTKTSHEILYMNYDINDFELQTTHLLGNDCWDRQRIKNKGKRLINKIQKLNRHEQQYLKELINKHI